MKNKNRQVLNEIEKIYYDGVIGTTKHLDWMGYPIDEYNTPTYHHIIKQSTLKSQRLNSAPSIDNCAYLGVESHDYLHYIEKLNKELYESWNYVFSVINKMKCYPIDDVWKIVFNLQNITDNFVDEYIERKEANSNKKR